MSLIDDENGPVNTPEFTVSELSGAVKRTVESNFSYVRVRGELGRVSRPSSGHIYLDLKDDRSVLSGVIWKGRAQSLPHKPEEGMEVVATGKLTTFPGQSRYQIVIDMIEPAGAGALMAMLEKRKQQLAAEGLFAPERKQRLPYLPQVVGVITSPSGSVIRDILHRLRDRFPRHVLVWPVAVQGQACAPQVTAAIEGFNALPKGGPIPRPDVLIVARGGGSLEDLWGFNEEAVARAAAASQIPLISAVGHETDTTLIDYASDRRAPTPTAAAEMAVPVRLDLLAWLRDQDGRMQALVRRDVAQKGQRLRDLSRGLPQRDAVLAPQQQRLDILSERLPRGLRAAIATQYTRFAGVSSRLRPNVLRVRLEADRRRVAQGAERATRALQGQIRQDQRRLEQVSRRFAALDLRAPMQAKSQKLDDLQNRAQARMGQLINAKRDRLAALERMRQTLGYTETLARGYAVVRAGDAVIASAQAAKPHAHMEIEFADGRVAVAQSAVSQPSAAGKRGAKPSPASDDQGSLF